MSQILQGGILATFEYSILYPMHDWQMSFKLQLWTRLYFDLGPPQHVAMWHMKLPVDIFLFTWPFGLTNLNLVSNISLKWYAMAIHDKHMPMVALAQQSPWIYFSGNYQHLMFERFSAP